MQWARIIKLSLIHILLQFHKIDGHHQIGTIIVRLYETFFTSTLPREKKKIEFQDGECKAHEQGAILHSLFGRIILASTHHN